MRGASVTLTESVMPVRFSPIGVGQIDGCECQLIVHPDVCASQLQQFACAK